MVRVEVYRGPGGAIEGFRARGHAGFDVSGRDIVCAAASAVVQTAVLGLDRYVGPGLGVEREPGRLDCRLPEGGAADPAVQGILETMVLGLKAIERQYPDHLRVRVVRVDGRR